MPSRDFRLHRLVLQELTSSALLSLLCKGGSVFATRVLEIDEAQKMLSRKKFQESGTSSLYKKLLNTQTTQSYMNAFMWLTSQVVRSFSTRTPLLPQLRGQIHLPPWHQASLARSYCRRRTWLGLTRCCVTCFLSACCSQWPHSLHCFIITHQQCLRQEKRYCQENHPRRSFSYGLSRHWFGCGWLQWSSLPLSADVKISFLLMKLLLSVLCLRCRAHTVVGSQIHSEQVGGTLWFSWVPGSQRFWKVNKHGAFSILRQALGLRGKDQSCHHETWLQCPGDIFRSILTFVFLAHPATPRTYGHVQKRKRQQSSDQDDDQRKKPDNETCFKNPQS